MPSHNPSLDQFKGNSLLKMTKEKYEKKVDEKIAFGKKLLLKTTNELNDITNLASQRGFWENAIKDLLNQAFFNYDGGNPYLSNYIHSVLVAEGEQMKNSGMSHVGIEVMEWPVLKKSIEASLQWLDTHKELLPLIEEDQTVVMFSDDSNDTSMGKQTNKLFNNKCFIVHGHSDKKHEIARFIKDNLKKDTVILEEQPSQGKTIIEKFEKHAADADFAVTIWTADDIGKAKKSDDFQARARQNVVYEMGYFTGNLGRGKVILLHEYGVEIPSDLLGVVYIDLSGNWKYELTKEVEAIYKTK